MSKNKKKIEESDELSEIVNDTEAEYEEEYEDEEYKDEETYDEEILNSEKIDDDIINTTEDINQINDWILISKENRITKNRLTKYEMVRILGERTLQLTMGAKPLVKNYENLDYYKIAEEELKLNMIPFKIRRNVPNKRYEIWELEELNKEHLLAQLD